MKAVVVLVLALLHAVVQAQLIPAPAIYVALPPSGATILLHDIPGPCVKGAALATWVAPDKSELIQGCYKINATDNLVHVVWFDLDTSTFSRDLLRAAQPI